MKAFYDTMIALGIIATALPAVILLYHRSKSKKSFEYKHKRLSLLLSLILLVGTLTLIWGSFVEPRLLVLNEQTFDIKGIGHPIRIAFIADQQVGPYKKSGNTKKIVNRILDLNPDLVFIGGDMIHNGPEGEKDPQYLEPFRKLTAQIPTYAIQGNHEYGVSDVDDEGRFVVQSFYPDMSAEVKEKMESLGVIFLSNEMELVEVRNQKFYLFGGDSYWVGKLDLSVLSERIENVPTITLIHNPLAAHEASKYDVDLMLAGHTHGGQIRLPFFGPIGKVDNITPTEWYQGSFELNSTTVFVTSGTGETGTRARLFNPPEIVLITLK